MGKESESKKNNCMSMYNLLKDAVPKDHSRQVTSQYFADEILRSKNIHNVMDLGCGAGRSAGYFLIKNPYIKWVGVDIESSPEVSSRSRTDGKFVTFNGADLPFNNNSFDMIFSNQVFQYVRYPRKLLGEIRRVLSPGGYFIGSVSYLEPYTSMSTWNYTPYGFKVLIEEAGMELKEIRPSIDALTLIIRRILRHSKFFGRYWEKESPLNKLINFAGFLMRKKHDEINLIKLLFCGQFVFLVQKAV